MSSLTVIGVGNRDRGDDAVGPVVCDWIDEERIPGVTTVVAEGAIVDISLHWGDADDVVIVDASAPAGSPGRVVEIDALAEPLAVPSTVSTHTVDVTAAIELARAVGRLPRTLTIVGVEARGTDHGAPLSDEVRAAAIELSQGFAHRITAADRAR